MAPGTGLPPIRSELRLVGRRPDASGVDLGIVYDPLRHRFFEIESRAIAILRHWPCGNRDAVVAAVNAAPGPAVTAADVDAVLHFLAANQLLARPAGVGRPGLFHRLEAAIGKLLLFRIPLIHPDRALALFADLLRPLLRPATFALFVVAALMAGFLVFRQWDQYVDSFRTALGGGGAVWFVLAIVAAKAWHEIGHALAAKRMGCAVPTMGVALMFGAPLLYTDLSDTWRLTRRRQRLLVAAGGILAETALAAVATWGWLILPDGPARDACFFFATVAWLATLGVNLNPFLRFDGYFMLSDLLGVPNLQERAFALGRGALRKWLWGVADPVAEGAPPGLARVMLVYAYATWAFRAVLYGGLAWTAFLLLPKLVAVPLLVAEIWVLLMRPIVKELAGWWAARHDLLRTRRSRFTLAALTVLVLWLAVPQRFQMAVPAVVAPQQRQWIHAPVPAQLAFHLPDGAVVAEGEVMAVFRDDDLDHRIRQARLRLASLTASEEQAARSQRAARDLATLRERIAGENAELSGLLAQQQRLTVRAGFAGRIRESATGLVDGRWQSLGEPLFQLVGHGDMRILAYVDDRDLPLTAVGAAATFHPDAVTLPVVAARVETVEAVPVETIDDPLLASVTGGPIATERDAGGRVTPRHGQYRIGAALRGDSAGLDGYAVSGTLVLDSKPHSLLGLAVNRLQALVIKGSAV